MHDRSAKNMGYCANSQDSCSFLRFLLRAFVQFMFLTPKPAGFPNHPADNPSVGAILGSNMICFFLHFLFNPPSAGEPTRGYLHGGLAMDFIGQKGPTSKVHLLLLDLLVVALQVTHMAAGMVRKRLKDASASQSGIVGNAQPTAPPAPALQQDLDSEERGVNRSDETQDIEMQTLNPSGTTVPAPEASAPDIESSEHDSLLATTAPRSDAHIFDAFNSGQIVVADLDLWKAVKGQWQLIKTQGANADHSSQAQTLRAELAGRVLRMRIRTDMIRQNLR